MKKQILKKILATTLALTCSISSFQISSLANSSLANNSWIKKGNFWRYLDKEGKLAKGWVLDKGKWYYLDENGIMKTSWVKINNRWFFLNPDKGSLNGAMLTGWNWVDGNCYYFDNNGYLLQDQISPDGYRVDASGRWVDNNLKPYFIKDKGFKSKPEEMSSNKKNKNLFKFKWQFFIF